MPSSPNTQQDAFFSNTPNMPSNTRLGIDLGGTKIEIIALDAQGQELYRTRTPTPKHSNPNAQYSLIIEAIGQLISDCETFLGASNLGALSMSELCLPVGIGIPGAISLKTGRIKNANTNCLIGRDFRQDLSQQLKRDILLENDANCFALSEAIDGAGKNMQSVFAVILGTGVGGGIVINKQLLLGANAISGEWGHNPLPWSDPQDNPKQNCYCGKQGCIETYLSGPGFTKQNKLQFDLNLNCQQVIVQKHSQPLAQQAYELYVERLAKSLASVINVLDPNVIVLGGGLSNIDSLYTDVPKRWGQYVFSDEVTTQLVKNTFGDSSGVRGAAHLI